MTWFWAVSATGIFAIVLTLCGVLRLSSAATRHLLLSTAFATVLLAPWGSTVLPRLDPVQRIQSSVVMVVTGEDSSVGSSAADVSASMFAGTAAVWHSLWLAVVALLFSRIVRALWSRRQSGVCADPLIFEMGRQIAERMGIARQIRFDQCAAAAVPETRGLLRPVVTLPAGAEHWPHDRLHIVLTHELIHVVRHDWIITVLAEAMAALHWFNPLAWIALRRLRQERELACDDGVIGSGVDRCDYAGHLLEVVSGLKERPAAPSVAMAHVSHLESRIRAILKPNVQRGGITMKATFGAATFATCLLLATSAMQSPAAQSGSSALSGTVINATSTPLSNASVIVRNPETRKAEIVRTNDNGEFVFPQLPPAAYDVEVAKAGFQLFRREKVALAPGSAQNLNIALSVGRINETINVVSEAPKPQAADTSIPVQRLKVGSVQHAKLVRQVRPLYPQHLKTTGVQGTVLFEAVIARDGTIQNLQVLNSMVHPDLVKAASEAVRQWQWEPTYLNGQPVEIQTNITVNFSLTK